MANGYRSVKHMDSQKVFKKTVLWENENPNSSFSAQTVTLSEDFNKFELIEFTCKASNTSSVTSAIMLSPTDLKRSVQQQNAFSFILAGTNGSDNYGRYVQYVSDTSLDIGTAYVKNSSSSNNSLIIPFTIKGLNK